MIPVPRPRRPSPAAIRNAIRAVTGAGLKVGAVDIAEDGRIRIEIDSGDGRSHDPVEQWFQAHDGRPA